MLDYEISKLLSPESIKQSVREIFFNPWTLSKTYFILWIKDLWRTWERCLDFKTLQRIRCQQNPRSWLQRTRTIPWSLSRFWKDPKPQGTWKTACFPNLERKQIRQPRSRCWRIRKNHQNRRWIRNGSTLSTHRIDREWQRNWKGLLALTWYPWSLWNRYHENHQREDSHRGISSFYWTHAEFDLSCPRR